MLSEFCELTYVHARTPTRRTFFFNYKSKFYVCCGPIFLSSALFLLFLREFSWSEGRPRNTKSQVTRVPPMNRQKVGSHRMIVVLIMIMVKCTNWTPAAWTTVLMVRLWMDPKSLVRMGRTQDIHLWLQTCENYFSSSPFPRSPVDSASLVPDKSGHIFMWSGPHFPPEGSL